MTKSEAKQVLQKVLICPVDFIYLFATTNFINKLSGVYKRTVYTKNRLQYQYINSTAVTAGETFESWRETIRKAIEETYGHTPYEILNMLAAGQSVAGKNWKAGVYGVGATYKEGFSQNAAITVDNTTGKLMQGGKEISGQTAVYTSSGKVCGYTATVDGAQYQSTVHGGKYYAGSYSTTEGQFNADGSVYEPKNAESIFQNMFTAMPQIQQFLEWLFSFFNINRGNIMTTNQVVANQSDWIKEEKNTTSTLLYLVAGAGLAALLFRK